MSVTLVDGRAPTVLVVDDNLQNREVAEGNLIGAGYAVIQAEGGAEALALLADAAPGSRPARRPHAGDGRLRDLPADQGAARGGRRPGALSHRARRSRDPQGGAGIGRRRFSDQAPQPDRAPDSRAVAAPDQAALRRAAGQRPGDPDAAGRAPGGAAAEGRADRADRPRSQEPAVEHPLQRSVRAEPGGVAGRRARVAGGRAARVAGDGAPGDEPARREPQRRRRAHPARLRVRAAGAAG